jgi:hypothetical protein
MDQGIFTSGIFVVFALLTAIIGFFVKKDIKTIISKLDSTVSKEDFEKICGKNMAACSAVRLQETRLGDERRVVVIDRLDNIIDDFDDLCKCLKIYTKGECP